MKVLIVEHVCELAELWRDHLSREAEQVEIAADSDSAIERIGAVAFDVVVIDLLLKDGDSGLAVADYVQYRRPEARIIFVTDTSFFSDGSIFRHTANARALVRTETAPEDLAALVQHYGSCA